MKNQELHNKLTTLLTSFNTLEEVEYLERQIETTSKINRRNLAGRQITQELLELCNQRAREIQKTQPPF